MVILYFIILIVLLVILTGFIFPVIEEYLNKELIKNTNELDNILQNIYHSEKRPLIKLESRFYSYPDCVIYIHKSKDRQWYMNDLWNLRNEPPLKNWKLKYKDKRTLVYTKNNCNIILKFS